jgi:hypothetical protein
MDAGVRESRGQITGAPVTLCLLCSSIFMMRPFVLKQDLRPKMSKPNQNVQKLDVQPLDIIRSAVSQGLKRLSIRRRSVKLDFWRGSFAADETVTTVEPSDVGH